VRQKLTSESLDGPPVRRGVAASSLLLRATRVAETEILTIASNSKSSAALHAAESQVRKRGFFLGLVPRWLTELLTNGGNLPDQNQYNMRDPIS